MKNLVFLAKVLHRLELSGLLPASENGDIRCDVKDDSGHIDLVEHGHQSVQADVVIDRDHESDQTGTISVGAGLLGFNAQEGEVDKGAARQHVRNLHWLIARLSRIAKYEAGHHPKESLKVGNCISVSGV